jgi:hypothetical protein
MCTTHFSSPSSEPHWHTARELFWIDSKISSAHCLQETKEFLAMRRRGEIGTVSDELAKARIAATAVRKTQREYKVCGRIFGILSCLC